MDTAIKTAAIVRVLKCFKEKAFLDRLKIFQKRRTKNLKKL